MLHDSLPLSRRPAVRTRSLDEARVVYSRMSLPVRLDQAPRRRFEWEGNYATLGPLTLSAHRFADAFTAESDSVSDTLALTIPTGTGVGECAYGGTTVTHAPRRTGGLSSGSRPVTMRMGDGYGSASVHIPSVAMRNAYVALNGESPKRPLLFASTIDLGARTMRSFLRTLRYAFDEIDDPRSLASTSIVGERIAESLLFGLLLSQPRFDAEDVTHAKGAPRHVRVAAEFLAANVSRPIRIAQVAEVAGVSVRALQTAFLAHHGCSPTDFLRARRLAHAQGALLERADATISQIALESGFTHLGRFSIAYREAFGETPRQTRARARRR